MGYYSRVTGEITVTPPILVRDLPKSPFLPGRDATMDVQFRVDEHGEEVDEGTLIRREVVAIVPLMEDTYTAYNLEQHIVDAVKAVQDAGSTCAGELVRVGESSGDVERYVVTGDTTSVHKETARLVWPDGSLAVW